MHTHSNGVCKFLKEDEGQIVLLVNAEGADDYKVKLHVADERPILHRVDLYQQPYWELPTFRPIQDAVESHMQELTDFTQIFDFPSYEFDEFTPYATDRLHQFVKDNLQAFQNTLDAEKVVFWIAESNQLLPWFSLHGNLFVSGSGVTSDFAEDDLPKEFTVSPTHLTIPVVCRYGLAGVLEAKLEQEIYDKSRFDLARARADRFGESLASRKIHELATTDPTSGVSNGLEFREALAFECAMRAEWKSNRQLVLLQFNRVLTAEDARAIGRDLKETFVHPTRQFRIASNVFSLLMNQIPKEDLHIKLSQMLETRGLTFVAVSVPLAPDITTPQFWFEKAAMELK